MPITQEDIRGWLKEGRKQHAKFMLVVCDTFDWEDYPVYIKAGIYELLYVINFSLFTNMQKIIECYDLSKDLEKQISEGRSWNGWSPYDPV